MGVAGDGLALGLDLEEAGGIVADCFLGLDFRFFPLFGSQFGEVGGGAAGADVAGDEMGVGEGDGDGGLVAVAEDEFFPSVVIVLDALETAESVFGVDDEFFFAQFFYLEARGLGALLVEFGEAGWFVETAEEFGKGEEGGLFFRKNETAREPLVPGEDAFFFLEAVVGEFVKAVVFSFVRGG